MDLTAKHAQKQSYRSYLHTGQSNKPLVFLQRELHGLEKHEHNDTRPRMSTRRSFLHELLSSREKGHDGRAKQRIKAFLPRTQQGSFLSENKAHELPKGNVAPTFVQTGDQDDRRSASHSPIHNSESFTDTRGRQKSAVREVQQTKESLSARSLRYKEPSAWDHCSRFDRSASSNYHHLRVSHIPTPRPVEAGKLRAFTLIPTFCLRREDGSFSLSDQHSSNSSRSVKKTLGIKATPGARGKQSSHESTKTSAEGLVKRPRPLLDDGLRVKRQGQMTPRDWAMTYKLPLSQRVSKKPDLSAFKEQNYIVI